MANEIELFATSFGFYNSTRLVDERITVGIPPVEFVNGKLDINFKSLVMTDHLILDKDTLRRTYELETVPAMSRVVASLKALEEYGYVRTIDFVPHYNKCKKITSDAVKTELQNPTTWLPQVLSNNKRWTNLQPDFKEILGKDYDELFIGGSYGTLCFLKSVGEKITKEKLQKYDKLITSKKTFWSPDERYIITEIVKPYLEEMYFNVRMREELKMPFIEWSPMGRFYQRHYKSNAETPKESMDMRRDLKRADRFFSIRLPIYRPERPRDLIEYLKNPRIESLRQEIRKMKARHFRPTRNDIDQLNQAIEKLVDINIHAQRVSKIKAQLGFVSKLLPKDPVTDFIADIAIDQYSSKGREQDSKENEWAYVLGEVREEMLSYRPKSTLKLSVED